MTATWKCPISCFMVNVNIQATTKSYFALWTWTSNSGGFAYIWHCKQVELIGSCSSCSEEKSPMGPNPDPNNTDTIERTRQPWHNPFKVMLHRTIRNDNFLAQNNAAMLKQCCNHSKQCRNNVATLCCVKNRRCESSRVTSPLAIKRKNG